MSEMDNILKHSLVKPDSVKEVKNWEMPTMKGQNKASSLKTVAPDHFEIEKRARMKMLETERKQGFNAGYMSGEEEGREKGKKEYEASIAKVEHLLTQLNQSLAGIDEAIEGHIVELVQAVAKQIIRKELSLSHEVIVNLVKESFKFLPKNTKGVKIYIHPEDKQMLEEGLAKETMSGIDQYELVGDEKIEPGGCIVQAQSSFVDQTVDSRIKEILEALVEGYEHEGPSVEATQDTPNTPDEQNHEQQPD